MIVKLGGVCAYAVVLGHVSVKQYEELYSVMWDTETGRIDKMPSRTSYDDMQDELLCDYGELLSYHEHISSFCLVEHRPENITEEQWAAIMHFGQQIYTRGLTLTEVMQMYASISA